MMIKPNEQRAKAAQIFLLVIILLYAISFVSTIFEYQLLNSWRMGSGVDMDAATSNDLRQQIIGIFQILAWIGSGIAFIMWFRRAYYNLHQKENMRYSDGWAAGGWFVPILNLWRPFQIMKEMYQTANQMLNSKTPFSPHTLGMGALGAWWFCWIINNFLGRISFQLATKAESINDFINASLIDLVATGWGLVTALLALKVVRDYAAVEPLLYKEEASSSFGNFDPEILDS